MSSAGTPTEDPPTPVQLVDLADEASLDETREPLSPLDSRNKKTKSRSTSTMPVRRRVSVTLSSERTSRMLQEKQMLMEEVKAQKVTNQIHMRLGST